MRTQFYRVMAVVVLSTAACGAPEPDPRPFEARIQELNADLEVGAVGEEVRTLHEYLTMYGYYPNAKLARDYPGWRPIIATAPADETVFDRQTTEAVRRLQVRTGLLPTGIVDQATRNLVKMVRCAEPDGLIEPGADDKFALNGQAFGKLALSWKLTNTDDGILIAAARNAVARAFATWAAETSLTFTQFTSGSTDITVQFGDLGAGSRNTFGHTDGHTSTLNTQMIWSVTPTTPFDRFDVETGALHEIGHAMGYHHSAFSDATMFPSSPNNRHTLNTDDKVIASDLYDTYTQISGQARDIGVGPDGSVWSVSNNAITGGYRVSKWNGTTWGSDGMGALRVAVGPGGIPWIARADHSVRRHTTNDPFTGSWDPLPGDVSDLAVGANGDAWVIGGWCAGADCPVFWWNGTDWEQSDGTAVKIAVGSTGNPWVIKANGTFYRHTTNRPNTGVWEPLPGISSDLGVGAGQGNSGDIAWSVGTTSDGKANLAVWDEQMGSGSGPSAVPGIMNWIQGKKISVGGPGDAVSVGPNGRPWLVDNSHLIFTSVR